MQKTVKLRVFGMTCDGCVKKVSNGLKEKEGVIDVKVSLNTGIAMVTIEQDRVKPEELETLPVFTGKSHYRAQVRENEG